MSTDLLPHSVRPTAVIHTLNADFKPYIVTQSLIFLDLTPRWKGICPRRATKGCQYSREYNRIHKIWRVTAASALTLLHFCLSTEWFRVLLGASNSQCSYCTFFSLQQLGLDELPGSQRPQPWVGIFEVWARLGTLCSSLDPPVMSPLSGSLVLLSSSEVALWEKKKEGPSWQAASVMEEKTTVKLPSSSENCPQPLCSDRLEVPKWHKLSCYFSARLCTFKKLTI